MEVHNPIARAAAKLRQHGHEAEAKNLEQFTENLVAVPATEQQILRGICSMNHAIDDEVITLNWSGKGKNALNELVACIARELNAPIEPAEEPTHG